MTDKRTKRPGWQDGTAVVTFRLRPETFDEVEIITGSTGETRSEFLKAAVAHEIERRKLGTHGAPEPMTESEFLDAAAVQEIERRRREQV